MSNEVAAVVGFLFFSGLYWLYTFKLDYRKGLARALMAAAVLFAFLGVFFSSRAYAINTIPSWDVWYTPANLWLSGLAGGGGLASATLITRDIFDSRCNTPSRWHAFFLALAGLSVIAGAVVLHLQAGYLDQLSNNVGALTLTSYRIASVRHTLECLAGLALIGIAPSLFKEPKAQAPTALAGVLLLAVGIFVTRSAFYGMYLSVGF